MVSFGDYVEALVCRDVLQHLWRKMTHRCRDLALPVSQFVLLFSFRSQLKINVEQ